MQIFNSFMKCMYCTIDASKQIGKLNNNKCNNFQLNYLITITQIVGARYALSIYQVIYESNSI